MAATLDVHATPEQIRAWRKTRAWRNLGRQVVREEPSCWLRLPGICQVRSTTADHVIPVATRPDLAMVRTNLHGACKPCNDWRQDMPIVEVRRRIADGTIQPKRVTPTSARRRMASRNRAPSRTAPSYFATSTPSTEKRCATTHPVSVGSSKPVTAQAIPFF